MTPERPDHLAQRDLRKGKDIRPCHPYLAAKGAFALSEQWVKDLVIRLLYIEQFPSLEYQKAANYCSKSNTGEQAKH